MLTSVSIPSAPRLSWISRLLSGGALLALLAPSAASKEDGSTPTTFEIVDPVGGPESTASLVEEDTSADEADAFDAATREALQSMADAFRRTDFFLDLRLRQETNTQLDNQPTRNRQRLRMRGGARFHPHESLEFGTRVTTGSRGSPTSPYVDLGKGYDRFEINLDQLYATWRPGPVPGAFVTAGKFSERFYRNPVYGELVMDADVQPEGVLAGYAHGFDGPLTKVQLVAGEYVLVEQSLADEASAFVVQAMAQGHVADGVQATAAVGWRRYANLTPDGSSVLFSENDGNAVDPSGTEFLSEFSILNPIVAVEADCGPMPVVLSGEFIQNLRADVGEDQGWALGCAVGKAKRRGEWSTYYQWQVVEQDAVLSVFSQDDFLLRTNHRSHVFGVHYRLLDQLDLHLWALVSARDKSGTTPTTDKDNCQWRLRADLTFEL